MSVAQHLLAVQSQDFVGGRWALAARTTGAPGLSDVDAAFDAGTLVRAWTMRGTLHTVPAEELEWVLSVTTERQMRQYASLRRGIGLADEDVDRAERTVRGALTGGGRLTRAEFRSAVARDGIDPSGVRGGQLLVTLALRGVVCWGPVVRRPDGPSREQYLVLADEWLPGQSRPEDPLAELFVRYLAGHGPAGASDFAWWAGLPGREAQRALEAAGDRVEETDPGLFVAKASEPVSGSAPEVVALPPFEEYFLSYADRSLPCAAGFLSAAGAGTAAVDRPILVARGRVVGQWSHSLAAGRVGDAPVARLLEPGAASAAEVDGALARYVDFLGR